MKHRRDIEQYIKETKKAIKDTESEINKLTELLIVLQGKLDKKNGNSPKFECNAQIKDTAGEKIDLEILVANYQRILVCLQRIMDYHNKKAKLIDQQNEI